MPAAADRLLRHVRRVASQAAPGDAALLGRYVARRDPAAFEALVARHGPMVLRVCRRVLGHEADAEDAFQATFLVLARKAQSVRPAGALAAWLHGVACRIALGARTAAARRRRREGAEVDIAPPDPHPDPLAELTAREALRTLDEEVRRLPEAYRLPVVLCCLEGLSQEEAARQLGWAPGSLKGRLERGRKRLHDRLARRGLCLAAGLALAEVGRVSAAGPAAALTAATVKAAAGAGDVPARVAALAEGGLRWLAPAKVKCGLVLLLAVGTATAGLAAWARHAPAREQPDDTPAANPPVSARRAEQARTDLYGDPLPPGAVARLGSLRLYHGQQVQHVTLSPDGKWVVSTAQDGNRLWGAATGRERPLRTELRQAAVFATRDKLVAVAKQNLDVQLWDVLADKKVGALLPAAQVGQLPETLHLFSPFGSPLALSPDGGALVICNTGPGGGTVLRFCDVAAGRVEEPVAVKEGGVGAMRLVFSDDGKTLVLQCNDSTVHVWDVAGRREKVASPAAPGDFGGAVALSPDGETLATAPFAGKRVRLWDTRTLKERPALLKQPNEFVGPVGFSPDGKQLVVAYSHGPTVRVWDLAARKEARRFRGKSSQVFYTAFSADGKYLAGGDGEGVTFWDAATGKFRHDFGHTYMVDSVHFSPDGRRVASGAAYTDNVVRVWEPLTGKEVARLRGHTSGIEVLAYSPDGKLIASGSQDGTVRLWGAATGREARRLEAKDGMVYAMAFAPDGKTLASGGKKAIHLWDVGSGKELRSFANPGEFILRLAFSPDGKLLATRGVDEKEVRLWDVARGEQVRRLAVPAAGCPSLVFSPDGRLLAVGGDNGSVSLWDVVTGEEHQTLAVPLRPGEALRVFSAAFSPDGRALAVGYGEGDHSVRLWELASGQVRARFQGHRGGVGSLAFSPDGTLLASGGTDRLITVWDARGSRTTSPPRAALTAEELTALWEDLAADAAKAHRAMQALLAAGGQAVPFLKARLRPAAALDLGGIDRLLADLDSDEFAVRERATRGLRQLGEAARPALRKALAGTASAEQRRRLKALLHELAGVRSPELLREFRSVEVLEQVGTPAARQVLGSLAGGGADARLTCEAKASLQRLARQRPAR